MRIAFILPLVLFCLPDRAAANDRSDVQTQKPELTEGARVRVETSDADGITGRIAEVTADTLLIELDDEARSIALPLTRLVTIEVSHGRRGRGEAAWSKAKWGALIGAVPSAILLGLGHEQIGEDGSSVGKAAALGAWSGGLFGGLIGAAIGASNPGEKWESVTPTFHIGPSTGRGGPGFSFAVTIGF